MPWRKAHFPFRKTFFHALFQRRSAINFAAVAHAVDAHDANLVGDFINHAVVAHGDAPVVLAGETGVALRPHFATVDFFHVTALQNSFAPRAESGPIFDFYMGKNTPERKDYIMDSLVVPVEE